METNRDPSILGAVAECGTVRSLDRATSCQDRTKHHCSPVVRCRVRAFSKRRRHVAGKHRPPLEADPIRDRAAGDLLELVLGESQSYRCSAILTVSSSSRPRRLRSAERTSRLSPGDRLRSNADACTTSHRDRPERPRPEWAIVVIVFVSNSRSAWSQTTRETSSSASSPSPRSPSACERITPLDEAGEEVTLGVGERSWQTPW